MPLRSVGIGVCVRSGAMGLLERRLMWLAATVFVTSACGTLPRPSLRSTWSDRGRLAAAAERFYDADTPTAMQAALEEAHRAGPASALFHELAARSALLEGRDEAVVAHLLEALVDMEDDSPVLHLHQLMARELTGSQRRPVRGVLHVLAELHPSDEVRALANHHLAAMLHQEGRFKERDLALARIPGRLDFAVVGTWDNEQGKAYDLELPPELDSSIDRTYEGRGLALRWRLHAPTDARGRLDLGALQSPGRWAAAFAQAEFVTPRSGLVGLRLLSSGPLKVWVDGRLVFATSELERPLWDQLVIPVPLAPGVHRVLVKSAHREGAWLLAGRVAPLAETRAHATLDDMLRFHVRGLPEGSSRRLAHLIEWGLSGAGRSAPVKVAEDFVDRSPQSLVARTLLVDALWFNQERGRTADALQSLDGQWGDTVPHVRLRQLRFHQQQGLAQRARSRLIALTAERPTFRAAWQLLAEALRSEGWPEDELRVRRELASRFPPLESERLDLARALLSLGRHAEARSVYDVLLRELPGSSGALRASAELEHVTGHLDRAADLYRQRLRGWPADFTTWLLLADTLRRAQDVSGASAALDAATALCPLAAAPFIKRGELAWERGDASATLAAWRRALELAPDTDSLANRVDFLSPEARGPWQADVPDEARLDGAVQQRSTLQQHPGADTAWLLDHDVTLLNSDGSTSTVVTNVVHAFNARGRDRIIRQALPTGRLRMMKAYSIDEKGVRSEASSERNRQVFFRAMQPGSTLVLQYRVDAPARGYLSRYWTEQWSFQGANEQREDSTLVLWAPAGTALHERRQGPIQRQQERRGDQLRTVWSAAQVPPVLQEPSMPGLSETAAGLSLSTVPDWKTWLSWQQALLDGAFQDSPETDALSRRLGAGADGATERLLRIHQFVMEEIRYQQDYETFIAGVKPHPAPMVLERRYGDCKDKAVLFITLARKLGLEAHFALVRTREAGPVEMEIPSQQFNHAIVYVPPQPGIEAGRFFDPTADLLDLEAQRSDDVGTRSLVFDPRTGSHAWLDIPFQAPEANRERSKLVLRLDQDGAARGTHEVSATGRYGASYRQLARNTEVMAQALQRSIGTLLPGGTVSRASAKETSLRQPAVVAMEVAASDLARAEGAYLRLRLPTNTEPARFFPLANRRHPLLLGAPSSLETSVELTLPDDYEVARLPSSGAIELPCMSLERTVESTESVVRSAQRLVIRCERLSAAEAGRYRERADEMTRLLNDELVLKRRERGPPARRAR